MICRDTFLLIENSLGRGISTYKIGMSELSEYLVMQVGPKLCAVFTL